MSHCSSRALTLLSSVFGACGLLLVGIAVSTDYWLYMEEGTVLPQNQTTEVKMALHAGLWRVCFFAGREKGRCVASEYFLEPEINLVTENTENILKTVRTATPFPMVSLFLVFTAFVISNIGHIRPQRTILAFVSGIFFILSGPLFRNTEQTKGSEHLLRPRETCSKNAHADTLSAPAPGIPRLHLCGALSTPVAFSLSFIKFCHFPLLFHVDIFIAKGSPTVFFSMDSGRTASTGTA
ncbi:voltage-dependent calcium channel gamma-7 subunit isoform X2 [Chionomys nivalis]|uniref:voltage-dependent calcium channel gamma-7 subunit isoform X2 n=1 Tax=Chionomys nivalis TaxID=269649 RepID=UPI0025982401|nr:voltage-dependent calcium channel gamma-7 subunit isoform X2 [Chionomys nivalis]